MIIVVIIGTARYFYKNVREPDRIKKFLREGKKVEGYIRSIRSVGIRPATVFIEYAYQCDDSLRIGEKPLGLNENIENVREAREKSYLVLVLESNCNESELIFNRQDSLKYGIVP